MQVLHKRLNLYIDPASYTFTPAEASAGARSLTIQRDSGEIVLNAPNVSASPAGQRSAKTIYGILGIISLTLTDYIIVLTGRELRGRLMGQDIYRATEYEILPVDPRASVQHPAHPVEAHLLALVRSHLDNGYFFFSYGWDLTRRLQAQWAARQSDEGKALWQVADDRFFWNKYLHSKFIDTTTADPNQDLSSYILPIMYGTFDIRSAYVNGYHLRLCLISRRSRYRAGTRYFRRGIDHDGHVANFNETEQLVLVDPKLNEGRSTSDEASTKLSFVQIRGSIPVFWAEVNNLRYKPDLQVMDYPDTANAMRKHFEEMISHYGAQDLVNLVNHKGHEQPVKEQYERYVAQLGLPDVRYEYFDFHTECRHMRWERISLLIEKLQSDLTKNGYFHLDATSTEPIQVQKGVVRTNCMDNLDRTNVTQAAIAKWTLNRQLRVIGVLKDDDSIDYHESLSKDFREMWADHADLISIAYAGTGALKTDFTRTGQRTKSGALEDGYKSVMRYLKNNYFDGPRQDAYDLMTGVWVPRRGPSSALFLIIDSRPLIIRSVPYLAFLSVFMILAGLTLPRTSQYSLFYYFLIWFTLFALSMAFIFAHGIDYVSWPRLLPPTEVIHYHGSGFQSARKGRGIGIPALDVGKLRSGAGAGAQWLAKGRKRAGSKLEEIEMGTKKRLD
ncbi:hypothetical protein GLOTRDRAFT_53684 [Gloeophyllum trabeum ATCC 11539]|uniref:SAC domain-containing protein n=1 Tax=Gloeophyllum trabeum (strain ATCC 11539 / FP-39264 / Madison 617) TaxID=670483 RepID=S7QNC9_GLOTA|nr:uncharacterized protein GLOTRDRAFT_53684 [Gloeophyllum trabeum ATCC 11539]EPQ61008.1 hypothetical protein GLOTRDRAFT_53684 [Gloeophyllum trabeum ATCC 11539]